jgi:hypothetical protein
LLQRLKTAAAGLVDDYDFAVEYRVLNRKRFQRHRQVGKFFGPVFTVATPELRLAAIEMTDHAITIKLQFMQPLVATRRRAHQGGKLRGDELGHRRLARAGKFCEVA